jgi:hypothetical protein
MRIYIHTGNHNNHHGIGDTVLFLKNALQDCGYTACISHNIEPGHVNVLTENFNGDHVKRLADGFAAGARYVMIGTEPVIGGTFNGGIDASHAHYSNSAYWKDRFEAFRAAMEFASAIWVLAESMLPGYQALSPTIPVRFLPHGYVNDFATVRQRAEAERDIDFYFSGALTDHRRKILASLMDGHSVIYHDATTPEYLRQDHLSRSKVVLALRLSPQNRIPSVSRMHYHLQNRSFVLQEGYAQSSPLDAFVMRAADDDIAGWAVASLALTNRREIAEAAHARFKAALPMTRLLPPLLDEALAHAIGAPQASQATGA